MIIANPTKEEFFDLMKRSGRKPNPQSGLKWPHSNYGHLRGILTRNALYVADAWEVTHNDLDAFVGCDKIIVHLNFVRSGDAIKMNFANDPSHNIYNHPAIEELGFKAGDDRIEETFNFRSFLENQLTMPWYDKQKLIQYNPDDLSPQSFAQTAMPWHDPAKLIQNNPDNLSPRLFAIKNEIIEAAATNPLKSLLEDYYPDTEADLLFILKASKTKYNKVEFPTKASPIYVVYDELENGTVGVIKTDELDRIHNAEEWVNDAKPSHYLNFQEEDFWEGVPPQGYKVYHGTYKNNINSIKRNGLEPRSDTRGLANRYMADGVFTSAEFETAAASFEKVIEIDVSAMKRDGHMPKVGGEEPVEEDQQRRSLAYHIGMQNYIGDESVYSSDGLSEDTIVFYGPIPPKYLKVVK